MALLLVWIAAACGANASSTSPDTTTRPAAKAPPETEAAKCTTALTPWTQYIADTDDFGGWVDTVGEHSPIVELPQNAAKVFLAEQSKSGTNQASTDGFDELDQACNVFAAAHPSFNFHAVPTAPTLTT